MVETSPAKPTNNMSALELLSWHVDMGVDEVIAHEAIDHFSAKPKKAVAEEKPEVATAPQTQQTPPKTNVEPQTRTPRTALTLSAHEGSVLAAQMAHDAKTIEQLKTSIESFEGCGLVRTAMNTVFADGNVDADIMIVGDAPNADEDKAGKSFAGEAGELLDKMMAAIGLDRETGFYASNIIPWRPPGNRKPSADELTICLPFIKRHIELAKPKILFLMGHTAISALLDDDTPTKNIRGKWRILSINKQNIDILPSYHPSRLLKQPQLKRDSWQDLLEIKRKIGNY
ncbi:MAG: hypothetical protein KAR62_01485 [Sphingomonadales bacterium]|nr:hypothetical protein [Sphingomonadales bacterium]